MMAKSTIVVFFNLVKTWISKAMFSRLESITSLPNSGVDKLLAQISKQFVNSGACSLSCNSIWFRDIVYAVEESASGRYDIATGWFAFGSDVSG